MCHNGCNNEDVNGECKLDWQAEDDCEAGGGNGPEIYEYPDSFDPYDVETVKRYAGYTR